MVRGRIERCGTSLNSEDLTLKILTNFAYLKLASSEKLGQRGFREIGNMLVVEFPERSLTKNNITVGYFKIHYQVAPRTDRPSHRRDKVTGPPKMLEHVTTDDYIRRFVLVFFRIVIRNEADISWNIF